MVQISVKSVGRPDYRGKFCDRIWFPCHWLVALGDQTIAEILLDQRKDKSYDRSISQKQCFGAGVLVLICMLKTSQENKVYYWGNTQIKVYSRVIIRVLGECILFCLLHICLLNAKVFFSTPWDDLDWLFLGQDVYEYGGHAMCLAKQSGPSVKETWWQSHLNHHNKGDD